MDRPKSAPHFVLDLYYSSVLVCTLSNRHAGSQGSRSPPLWSPRGTTGAPRSPPGAQPPVSLAQSGNILRDVKLHQQEAEGLAGCHGAFVDSQAAGSQPAHLTASTPRAVPRCYIYGTYSLPQQEEHGCYAHQHFSNTAWKQGTTSYRSALLPAGDTQVPNGGHGGTPRHAHPTPHRQEPTPDRALSTGAHSQLGPTPPRFLRHGCHFTTVVPEVASQRHPSATCYN